jgi:Domain of unknown function (DUF4328)
MPQPMPGMPPPPTTFSAPPGYVAYGGPGAAMPSSFQRIKGLAKAIDVLLIISIPLQALGIVGLFQIRAKARDFLAGNISRTDFSDAAGANLSSLSGLLVVPIAVLTIITMYRMAANLRRLGRSDARWAPGWAIAGWFCPPCAIYVIPWLMFRELWRGSDPAVPAFDGSWKQGRVPPLVDVWWVLYGLVPLLGIFAVGNIGAVRAFGDVDWDEIARTTIDRHTFTVVLAVISIVTTVVYLVMMRQLTARHMSATRER